MYPSIIKIIKTIVKVVIRRFNNFSFFKLKIYQTAKVKIQNLKKKIVFFNDTKGSIENIDVSNNIIKKSPKIFEYIFL